MGENLTTKYARTAIPPSPWSWTTAAQPHNKMDACKESYMRERTGSHRPLTKRQVERLVWRLRFRHRRGGKREAFRRYMNWPTLDNMLKYEKGHNRAQKIIRGRNKPMTAEQGAGNPSTIRSGEVSRVLYMNQEAHQPHSTPLSDYY